MHILMAALLIPRFPECCTTAALASPSAQLLSRRAYRLLGMLRFSLLPPIGLPALPPAAECAVLMTYTHITFGLVLPGLAAALTEAALFRQHQRQRRQAGLPPERGWDAAVHSAVGSLLDLDWLAWGAAVWLLAGLLFDVAVLVSGAT